VRIDLHTHSDRSDGTTSPAEVVRAARRSGLDVLALTDHDTAAGWAEAGRAAGEVGLVLVPGMEISCRHAGRALHLLAYLPDPTYPPLQEVLATILAGRDQRVPTILAKLQGEGIDLREDEVREQSVGAAAVGRPHVADALVARGVVRHRTEAFDRYLSPGRPAYVTRYAPPVDEVLAVVRGAGGVAVVAHPWGRTDTSALQEDGLAALQARGLAGIEADHQDHSPGQRAALKAIAADLGLLVTGSSDYHGAGKADHELGCNTTEPEQLDRLLGLAQEAAAASGRATPTVVRPS
jgi:predicted metal-dependent phosphoesterase TrpH